MRRIPWSFRRFDVGGIGNDHCPQQDIKYFGGKHCCGCPTTEHLGLQRTPITSSILFTSSMCCDVLYLHVMCCISVYTQRGRVASPAEASSLTLCVGGGQAGCYKTHTSNRSMKISTGGVKSSSDVPFGCAVACTVDPRENMYEVIRLIPRGYGGSLGIAFLRPP